MRRVILLAALLTCLLQVAQGQSVEFAVAYPPEEAGSPGLRVAFEGMPSAAATGQRTASLRLSLGDELALGVRLRQAGSLASIGSVVTTLAADGSTGGRHQLALSGRGSVGPLALRVRGSVSDGIEPLWPLNERSFTPLPLLGAGPPLFGLELGGAYRVSRQLIVDAAPGLFLRGGRLGARLDGEVRLVRAVGGDDLSLLLHAFAEPGFARAAGALGAGYTVNRRRAPSWTLAALVGWGPAGLLPGARVEGAERLAAGGLRLSMALEPYRLDTWPYRLELGYEHQLGVGELVLVAQAGLEPDSGWQLGGRAGYRLPFTP
jgi:hypothetical protein